MSAKSKLTWVADELASVEKALRVSHAQGGMFMFAMTAPGREWTVVNGGLGTFGSKVWALRIQTPRTLYVGFRFYVEPLGAGTFRYSIREDGTNVSGVKGIVGQGDYAHVHRLTKGLDSASPVVPLTMELVLEAKDNSMLARDLQIFGLHTADLPARVQSFQEFEEFLTTS